MAFIKRDRQQTWLMPPAVEDYIPADDPVRPYDAFGDALDLRELGFELQDIRVGAPEFDPRAMIKLLIYGYSCCHHILSFIWLTGDLRPDHKTNCGAATYAG